MRSNGQPSLAIVDLGRLTLVMLHQAAKAFTVNDLTRVSRVRHHPTDGHIANPLVWPFCVIISEEFRDNVVEMLLAENYEMIQALVLECLHKSLDVRICIYRQLPLIVTVRFELFG